MSLVQNENYRKIFNQSKENWKWFEENRERLAKDYVEEFVVIADKKVVAHNSDLGQVLDKLPPEYRAKEHLIEYLSKEGIELVL